MEAAARVAMRKPRSFAKACFMGGRWVSWRERILLHWETVLSVRL